jgi:hypothetical protein
MSAFSPTKRNEAHNSILIETIHLPKPFEKSENMNERFLAKIDTMANQTGFDAWEGNFAMETLFCLYLLNKYKSHCLLHRGQGGSNGFMFHFHKNGITNDYNSYITNNLAQCIKRKVSIILIPVSLAFSKDNNTNPKWHANLLIYRRKFNTIEHFEPHGQMFKSAQNMSTRIYYEIHEQINYLNDLLAKEELPTVQLISSQETCPRLKGLQSLEGQHGKTRRKEHEIGYCAAWSLFFMELALCNPDLTSSELYNIIFRKFKEDDVKMGNYLLDVIRGYTRMINEKVVKFMHILFGYQQVTVENLYDSMNNNWEKYINDITFVAEVEMELLNNPELSRDEYIDRLYNQLSQDGWEEKNNSTFRKAKTANQLRKAMTTSPTADNHIVIPIPIEESSNHTKLFHAKVDKMMAKTGMNVWNENPAIITLFYLYLLKKYKSHCLLFRPKNRIIFNSVKEDSNGIGFYFLSYNNANIVANHSTQVIDQIAECILRGESTIIIPVLLLFEFSKSSHATVLIYRKKFKTIEHFDPHRHFLEKSYGPTELINRAITTEIRKLNEILGEKDKVVLVSDKGGPIQSIKEFSPSQEGYCAAWCLFMTELALCNPEMSIKELQFEFFENSDRGKDYFLPAIQGYTRMIFEKILHLCEVLFDKKLTLEQASSPDIISKLANDIAFMAEVEMDLFRNRMTEYDYIDQLYKDGSKDDSSTLLDKRKKAKLAMNLTKHFLPSPPPNFLGGRKSRKSKSAQNKGTIKTRSLFARNINH